MNPQKLTDRQKREQAYYDEYSQFKQVTEITFDPVAGLERRPWNTYWQIYEFALTNFKGPGQRLLDFGCGSGMPATRYAHIGYEVHGFDVSQKNIENAQQLAQKYGLAERTHYSIQTAERLEYPDNFFDLVVGMDILHHVEIERAVQECRRVLRPGGRAIFREHIKVPMLDRIRNTRLLRRLVPKEKSLDRHITEDERKLTEEDVEIIRGVFPGLQTHRFTVFSRVDPFVPQAFRSGPSRLEMLDYFLVNAVPGLGRLGGTVILVMEK